MEEAKNVAAEPARKKLSYEELENIAGQLDQQAKTLYRKLQEANMSNFFTRLNFLFDVVRNADRFSKAFVDDVVSEIEDALRIPDADNPSQQNPKDGE